MFALWLATGTEMPARRAQDAATRQPFQLLAVLDAGKNPHQIAFSSDGRTAYVAAAGSNWVARVDALTYQVRDYHRVADAPLGVAALPRDRIVVSRFASDRVSRYSFKSETPDNHLVTGAAPSLLVGPLAQGGYLVSSEGSDRLWLLDLDEMTPLSSVQTGRRPFPPAVTSDGRLAFVPNYDDGTVSVIELRQRRVVRTVPVGKNPSGGVVLPGDRTYAVTVRGEDRVALLDIERLEVTGSWKDGVGNSPFSVVLSRDGRLAFVNNTSSHDVSVMALPQGRVVARIPVGQIPIVMAVHPSGRTLWVSSEGSHTVSVVKIPPLGSGPIERLPVDLDHYRPSQGTRESEQRMREACLREVVELHEFFQKWLSGEVPLRASNLERVGRALAKDFEIVSPAGNLTRRAQLLESLESRHGTFREPPLRIWVENIRGRGLGEGLYLVTYEEWQQVGGQPKRGRLSTAVFRREPSAPQGVQWVHVHETRIE